MKTLSNYARRRCQKSRGPSSDNMKNALVWFLALAIGLSSTIPAIPGWITQRKRLTTASFSPGKTTPGSTSQSLKLSTTSESPSSYLTTIGFKLEKSENCEKTSSPCVYFYPDHPDAGRSIENKHLFCTYSYSDHPDPGRKRVRGIRASTSTKNTSIAIINQKAIVSNESLIMPICEDSSLLCTYLYVGYSDPTGRQKKTNYTPVISDTDEIMKDFMDTRCFSSSTSKPLTELTSTLQTIKTAKSVNKYKPCSDQNGIVNCKEIPVEEVKQVFNQNYSPKRLASVTLILQPSTMGEGTIPKDVFGNQQVSEISIGYHKYSFSDTQLEVDVNAFQSTKGSTTKFKLSFVDCTLLDLSFLSGFDKLAHLMFSNIDNIQDCLPSLPLLPRLTFLRFELCSGLKKIKFFPNFVNGLEHIRFENGHYNKFISNKVLDDITVDRIIDWLLLSSANTLEGLSIIDMSQVTQVPNKTSQFKVLKSIELQNNAISTIKSGAFSFSVPVYVFHFYGNGISKIEPDAFKGDFKDARVFIFDNNFTLFEEAVFGSMVQQMASGSGYIQLDLGDQIKYSEEHICRLAWLKRYEANAKSFLKCSDGSSFEKIQPASFNHCP